MVKYDALNLNPFSVHQKIIQCVGKQKKVLDVGCAVGILAKEMKNNDCEVVGIELDEKSANIAQEHCVELVRGDVESIELKDYYSNFFDFIIFADVLEHLRDPDDVLKRFVKYLKDDGYIIVSLPNIANWRIRLKLLSGNFNYETHGILDESHLRFFTEKTVKDLITNSKLEISKFDVAVGDVDFFAKFLYSVAIYWPNLFAYQFLVIANKL
jgi:methionine biosynthesis protein MetW